MTPSGERVFRRALDDAIAALKLAQEMLDMHGDPCRCCSLVSMRNRAEFNAGRDLDNMRKALASLPDKLRKKQEVTNGPRTRSPH